MKNQNISLKKVSLHNLKNVDLTLPTNQLIIFSGISGSGKSSMAFDTIYAEGQRRYIESLSTFARKQMGEMGRPQLESASGITPTIAIEQKTAGKNPRSTVGTLTEVYDYLRLLYARIATPHCPISGEAVAPQSVERIIKTVQKLPVGTKLIILSPYAQEKKGEFKEDLQDLLRKGFTRARIDGNFHSLADPIALEKNTAHTIEVVIDRLVISLENASRTAEAVIKALEFSQGTCIAHHVESLEDLFFSQHAFSQKSGLSYNALEPHDFSFNSPHGMCERCHGMGRVHAFDLDKIIDPNKSIAQDCCMIARSIETVQYGNIYRNLSTLFNFSLKTPWKKLSKKAQNVFLYGTPKKWTKMTFVHPKTGKTWVDHVRWQGILHEAHKRFQDASSESYKKKMSALMTDQLCSECHGERLKPYPRAAQLHGKRIGELTELTIKEAHTFFSLLSLKEQEHAICEEVLKEILERLHFLLEVGLHYLTLNRTAPTLSGGEAQRVRLASQIGCGLVGVTYILDEPSIGLHPRDNHKLIATLRHLTSIGNTVIVVEHDEETIWAADHIVDFGPGAGHRGGEVVVSGDHLALLNAKDSITGQYISHTKKIHVPKKRRKPGKETIRLKGASHHNLKNVTLTLPLGLFISITGVSGSGKSSLITETLYPLLVNHLHHGEQTVGAYQSISGMEHLEKVIGIDQSPIGQNPRSNPATYIKLFDEIRTLFAELPESKARGYLPGRFSFNVAEGSCPECNGMGEKKIDLDFLDAAWVTCSLCEGRRFDLETLSVYFKGKNIHDLLEMEVCDAIELFENFPSIKHKLHMLQKVGLDYLKLGQSSTTLSGGEAQRVKLAKELVRPSQGKTLYILDEPTTGLHFHDVNQLLNILHELTDRGNTVLVIEHNMDVVKTSDWVIDLGPDGGAGGGEIIAAGSPEKIAQLDTPTSAAIHAALNPRPVEELLKEKKIAPHLTEKHDSITITGAQQNNLKRINVTLPREKITICTGPSGSGKSSFAFETLYAEGQRRYVESLSPYARQFVKQMSKPKVSNASGLSPAIAIEQKAHAGNPRSTVGTLTEVYDYLRVLFARIGVAHCPETGEVITSITKQSVIDRILHFEEGTKVHILAPITLPKGLPFETLIAKFAQLGFVRLRLNGTIYSLEEGDITQAFDPKQQNHLELLIDRVVVKSGIEGRLADSIEQAVHYGKNTLLLLKNEEEILINLAFSVPSTGKSYPLITPHTFAFNTPSGMCPECEGLGTLFGADITRDPFLSLLDPIQLLHFLWKGQATETVFELVKTKFTKAGIALNTPLIDQEKQALHFLLQGEEKTNTPFRWVGINTIFAKLGKAARKEIRYPLQSILDTIPCFSCQGSRLNPLARHVTINDLAIHNLTALPLDQLKEFLDTLSIPKEEFALLEETLSQLKSRMQFILDVGLNYLSLDRTSPTLSGGEAQRIRLARQLGCGLTGVLYVLDEPTTGLHPSDTHRLLKALNAINQLGNTLVMVEHDQECMKHADLLIDFGPGAGIHGGHVTASGTLQELLLQEDSLTGNYLSGKRTLPLPKTTRKKGPTPLSITNANAHNLKNISLEIPTNSLVLITGVSGSGKSTLVNQVIKPAVQYALKFSTDTFESPSEGSLSGLSQFDRLLTIDQNPIGHTIRSDVCTYTDVLTPIRQFFSQLPHAKAKGLQPGHFSYNHRKGMCSNCYGLGYSRIEMHFLPTIQVKCPECEGLRLNPLSLEVKYQQKNLGEILQYTVDQAADLFQDHRSLKRQFALLKEVGLGYLTLGQEMVTLSGGEAQRIKLSRELAKRTTGHTLYLIDEPTRGLHFEDLNRLIPIFHKLVDQGNSVIIIEHNIDLIRNADHIIDLGPGAGASGGQIVATGTPSQIKKVDASLTGRFI